MFAVLVIKADISVCVCLRVQILFSLRDYSIRFPRHPSSIRTYGLPNTFFPTVCMQQPIRQPHQKCKAWSGMLRRVQTFDASVKTSSLRPTSRTSRSQNLASIRHASPGTGFLSFLTLQSVHWTANVDIQMRSTCRWTGISIPSADPFPMVVLTYFFE
jgi:hypothetical protein